MSEVIIFAVLATVMLAAIIYACRLYDRRKHKLAYVEHVLTQKTRALERLDEAYESNKVAVAYNRLYALKQALIENRDRFLAARKKQSWWKKMTTAGFDEYEFDKSISEIDHSLASIEPKYKIVRTAYENKVVSVSRRCERAKQTYRDEFYKHKDKGFDRLMAVGLLSAAASIPMSMALDLNKAGDIYDAMRTVNGNFADMGNFDIWMQTLLMPEESLQGLISLTKGAYFEQLVAAQYQGTLHEHFNHADTDITIEGIEYQIKATDSIAYIETVDLDTPIIATSEIASASRAIDSGISNLELDHDVAAALGGSIIDASDVALDAALSGLGGVGVMAAISGATAATRKYNETGSLILATGSGIGATGTGVARTAVNTAELTYKVGKFGVKTVAGGAKLIGKLAGK